jgi:hypothetical protein
MTLHRRKFLSAWGYSAGAMLMPRIADGSPNEFRSLEPNAPTIQSIGAFHDVIREEAQIQLKHHIAQGLADSSTVWQVECPICMLQISVKPI